MGQVNADDTVFVYARAAEGPPMPLAVKRITVAELPTEVILDDSDAMTPAFALSGFDRVIVGARISGSGNAIAQPGDIEGLSDEVVPGESGVVTITMDNVVE
jgi:cytochrome c-type biogenesis protein CcmH